MKEIFQNRETYFKWRVERVKRIEKRFPELFDVKGKKVLDVGCGAEAPLSFYLTKKEAKVWGGEINKEFVKTAKKFAPKAEISLFFAEHLPFENESFDIVYLWDILEHVRDPLQAVKEAKRVCKKEGLIFIEFSPYWAYPTGQHLYVLGFPKGFLPFQIMLCSWTKKIVLNSILSVKDTPEFIFEQFILLNKLSISKFKKIVRTEKLKKIKEFHFISLPNKEIKINFISKIPLLKELFTMSYSCLLRK